MLHEVLSHMEKKYFWKEMIMKEKVYTYNPLILQRERVRGQPIKFSTRTIDGRGLWLVGRSNSITQDGVGNQTCPKN